MICSKCKKDQPFDEVINNICLDCTVSEMTPNQIKDLEEHKKAQRRLRGNLNGKDVYR